jgi:hypothetical protein
MGAARLRLALRVHLVLLTGLVLGAPTLEAQGRRLTELTLTGFPLTTTTTTVADFDAGFVSIGTTNFTVDLTRNTGGGGFSPRLTTVRVLCALPCPASGTLPPGALQWRRADLGAWNAIGTTGALVESRTAAFDGVNDPWGNAVEWRYALTWTGTPPTTATQFNIAFELVVTAP